MKSLLKVFYVFSTVLLVLSTYSCLSAKPEVTVNLQINKPDSQDFKIQSVDAERNPLAIFDINITKVTVIVKKGTTKVFEQDFSSLNNISFKLSDAGNYRIEAYAYANLSGSLRGIFYGVKEQMLNFGTNFITLEGVFFNSTVKFKIESTQLVVDKWNFENCVLVFTKNSAPSNVVTHNLTSEVQASPLNFEKNIEIEPGIWKVNLTLKLKNKINNEEFVYNIPENSYLQLYPSTTENLTIKLNELEDRVVVNATITSFTKPYVEPVRNLIADYLKSTDKLILSWEYPEKNSNTKFQIFKKLKSEKLMRLVAETTNTYFETNIGDEFQDIEYFGVNVIKDGKESGVAEVTDVITKIIEPKEGSFLSGTVNVKAPTIDFGKRVVYSELRVNNDTDQRFDSLTTNFSFDTTKYVDGTYNLNVIFSKSGSILAEDFIKINIRNWQKVYGLGTGYDIIETNNKDGYIIVSYLSSNKSTSVTKISKEGELIWQKSFNCEVWGRNTISSANNGYIITGGKEVSGRGWDGYVFKIDENGSIVWEKTFGGTKNDYLSSINKLSDGNYLVGGYKTNTYGSSDYRDGYLLKIKEDGSVIWEKTYTTTTTSGGSNFGINAAKELKDKRICIVGYGQNVCWLAILDSNGNLINSFFYGWRDAQFLDFTEVYDGFVLSYYNYYYRNIGKFTLDTGQLSVKWEYDTSSSFSNVTTTSDGRIIFASEMRIIKARNLPSYTQEWRWSSPVSGALHKVIEDSNGDIVGVGYLGDRTLVVKIKGNGSWYY
ncbi:MAG: hypothetical protein N2252_01225 [Candidatus Kryptonium sp.]|nr:hypothetical protein [Candidatus Kryptonium sp.]